MTAKRKAALGFMTRTGRAAVVAVGGSIEDPEILGKVRIDVATTFDEGAVFHVGQEMPLEKALSFLRDSEARFVQRARAELAAFTAGLGVRVVGAGLVAGPPKRLPPVESILKSHPIIHAAEGELYRRVFIEAAAAIGPRPTRIPPDGLTKRAAAALGLTPSKVTARLAAMGKACGRPWAAEQKQAALVAWIVLAEA